MTNCVKPDHLDYLFYFYLLFGCNDASSDKKSFQILSKRYVFSKKMRRWWDCVMHLSSSRTCHSQSWAFYTPERNYSGVFSPTMSRRRFLQCIRPHELSVDKYSLDTHPLLLCAGYPEHCICLTAQNRMRCLKTDPESNIGQTADPWPQASVPGVTCRAGHLHGSTYSRQTF